VETKALEEFRATKVYKVTKAHLDYRVIEVTRAI
jgi:hypothetical protein